jgi:hypothetical protein
MAEPSTALPRRRMRRSSPGLGASAGPGAAATAGVATQNVRYARLCGAMALVFAVLFVLGLVLVHRSPALSASDSAYAAFYAGTSSNLVTVGLYLVPFAGIAFLWHMVTARLLIGARTREPSPIPYALQLVSGVLFVALLFAGTATAGSVALLKELSVAPLPSPETARALLGVGYGMVFVYAVRGAGMYAITTTTLLMKAGVLPRWLALLGYLMAAFLLVSTTLNPVVVLLFPTWAAVVGVVLILRGDPPATSPIPHEEREGAA